MTVLSGCSGIRLSSVLRDLDRFSTSGSGKTTVQRSTAGQHVVRRGETVYAISNAYEVPMRLVIEKNHLKAPYALRVGQVLKIPFTKHHVVHRGETVYRIAKMHSVDLSALVRVNNLHSPYTIHIGQKLRLPGRTTNTVVASSSKSKPVVKRKVSTSKTKVKASQKTKPKKVVSRTVSKPKTRTAPRPASIPKPPPRQGKTLAWPVRGKILVPYGAAAKGMRNDGINIKAKLGTSIRAAESGVVAYAGNELKGFGNMLLLKHDKGMITTYAHANKIKVKRGAVVKRGQIIASVGQTGSVTSPQLHFEVRQGSKAINPMKLLH